MNTSAVSGLALLATVGVLAPVCLQAQSPPRAVPVLPVPPRTEVVPKAIPVQPASPSAPSPPPAPESPAPAQPQPAVAQPAPTKAGNQGLRGDNSGRMEVPTLQPIAPAAPDASPARAPLTEYFMWPRKDAWEELKAALEAKAWVPERDRVLLLNRTTEVINFWQDEGVKHSVEEAREKFPDCVFSSS